jgi:ABC-type uncharacterized transport system involved in gliding motility auxiliary subunit
MNMFKRFTLNTSSLLILAVLLVAVIMLSNALFRGMRADLTENNLYSVSEGTRNILKNLDEPINLYFFFSDRTSKDIPFLRTYANRVRELLEELDLHADGKLNVQVIDPLPFSEEEDRASGFGLQSIPVGTSGDNIFLGLAGTNSTDGLEIISFFQPDKEAFLEYDLAKLIYTLANPEKTVIGVLSKLPMARSFDPATQQMREPWAVYSQMESLFEVRELPHDATEIDPEVDVLMLVHPRDLSDATRYAIDQYVLGGGKALIFVDPNADLDTTGQDPNNPMMAMMAERSSNLPELFKSWGIEAVTDQVIGDARFALEVNPGRGRPPVRHLALISVTADGINEEDVITGGLSSVNFATTGFIRALEDATTTMEPLIQSSRFAMPIEESRTRFTPDPSTLQEGFKPTSEQYALAVRVQGDVKSSFPDGPPETNAGNDETAAGDADSDDADGADEEAEGQREHLEASVEPINVVVVADTDPLGDRLWVRVQSFLGQNLVSAWANNGDFVINALDNLTGSSDLIAIRGRATSARPFDTVDELRANAEDQFRATEQQLQEQLQETERKLNDLQARRDDTDNVLILTDEQRAELERFQQQKVEIRKQLRQVQRNLDKDIERLGTTMKVINIGLMPLVVSICAVVIAVLRIRRRRSARGNA